MLQPLLSLYTLVLENNFGCDSNLVDNSFIRVKEIVEELSVFFQRNAREICLGAMVSVTVVRVTSDLSLARCYVSIFAGPEKEEVLTSIRENVKKIRGEVGKRLKNMRKIPELLFFIDDSLDYASQIDVLLKKS